MLSVQHAWWPDAPVQLVLGGQVGAILAHGAQVAWVGRTYALAALDMLERGRCSLGPYLANDAYVGHGQYAGAFFGCDFDLVPHDFGLVVEWDVGAHASGEASFVLAFTSATGVRSASALSFRTGEATPRMAV